MKGIGNMMRQAQQMQTKMADIQEALAEKTIEASAGGGMVTCVVNGKQVIQSLTISPEVVNPDDVEMLQDLIIAAISDAITQSQAMVNDEMQKVAGGMGLNIPGLF
jgi:DNA-binding YbaB/EbfC family protein